MRVQHWLGSFVRMLVGLRARWSDGVLGVGSAMVRWVRRCLSVRLIAPGRLLELLVA